MYKELTDEQRRTLPKSPGGTDRIETWVVIAASPKLVMPLLSGQTEPTVFHVDDEWLQARVDDYTSLLASGYYEAGHLTEHNKLGKRSGDVSSLHTWTDPRDGRNKLLASVRWIKGFDPQDLIDSGELRYASPSWTSYMDERGKMWKMALSELSAVTSPHQKHLAVKHYLGENASPTTIEDRKMEETLKKILVALEALTKSSDATVEQMTSLAEHIKKPEDAALGEHEPKKLDTPVAALGEHEPKKPVAALGEHEPKLPVAALAQDTPPEVALLKAKIAKLEEDKSKQDFKAFAAKNLAPMSEKTAGAAYRLAQHDPEAFSLFASTLASKGANAESITNTAKWRWNLGSAESAPNGGGSMTREECAAKVTQDNGTSEDYRKMCLANGIVI